MRTTDFAALPAQSTLGYHRSPPSFSYKCREFLHKMALNPDAECYRASTKLGAYLLLDRIGVGHARVYGVLDGIDQLTPEQLERPVVLKPLEGWSAVGVMLLKPATEGRPGYYDRISRQKRTFDEVVAHGRKALDSRGFPDKWLLEEPLSRGTRVPDDFKFYAFQGDIALILQRRGRPGRSGTLASYRWYDANWNPVDTGKHTKKTDPELTPPDEESRTALAEVARRVSTSVPFAFTRVDTFATDRGPMVGEVNAWVGAYDQFNDEWDHLLGACWEASELRIPPRRGRPIPAAVPRGAYPVFPGLLSAFTRR